MTRQTCRRLAVAGMAALAFLAAGRNATAQTTPNEPFAITDNSFFVEEAFNQERGIFQNIFVWQQADGGGWSGSFTQEFPAPAMRHQLSYTVQFAEFGSGASFSSVLLNYRYQALEEAPGRPAFSPRFSVILPTGPEEDFADRPGFQINLPVSKQVGDFYLHGNAGVTRLLDVPLGETTVSLTSPFLAGSIIYRLTPMVNLMLESVVAFTDDVIEDATERERSVVVAPGVRTGWNFGEKQLVLGAAVPIATAGGKTAVAVLGYLSYELPYRSKP